MMKGLQIVFLGTGTSTGVPVIACDCPVCQSIDPRDKRLRTSALIIHNNKRFVIDCGPDFRYQMIRENVPDLRAILFTHQHRDHIAGLDDIRAFNYILNQTVDIYASMMVQESIRNEFPYIFEDTGYFGSPRINLETIRNHDFTIDDTTFTPIRVMHDKMPVYGFRLGSLCYITDASFIPQDEMEKLKGCKILVINALRKSRHVSHFSLDEALKVIEKVNPQKAYLTHMSHFIGLHDEVEKSLPNNVHVAYDGLKVNVE